MDCQQRQILIIKKDIYFFFQHQELMILISKTKIDLSIMYVHQHLGIKNEYLFIKLSLQNKLNTGQKLNSSK